jgi:hypothetical protein
MQPKQLLTGQLRGILIEISAIGGDSLAAVISMLSHVLAIRTKETVGSTIEGFPRWAPLRRKAFAPDTAQLGRPARKRRSEEA